MASFSRRRAKTEGNDGIAEKKVKGDKYSKTKRNIKVNDDPHGDRGAQENSRH